LSKASSGLSKVIAQLTKVESLLKSIGDKSSYIGKHTKGADISAGSAMMPSSMGSFSTSHISGGNVLEGSLAKFSAGQAALAIAGGAYGMLPSTNSAISTAAALHAGSAMFLDSYNPQRMGLNARASFGNNQSSNVSAAQAAATLAMSGMNPNSAAGRSIMGTAGVAYQALGMDNVTAAAALNNTYGGARGAAMMGVGINTYDSKGKPLSMTSIINQLYGTLYRGLPTRTSDQIMTDFQAGNLGDSLTTLGITDPNERQQYLLQIQMKAQSVRNGTKYDSTKVPANLMNDKTNPFIGQGKKNAGEANAIDAAMPGLVQGVNDANTALGNFQNALADTIHTLGDFGQAMLRVKGAGDTAAGTSIGQGIGSAISDGFHFLEARSAIKALGFGEKALLGKHSPIPSAGKGVSGAMRSLLGKLKIPGMGALSSRLAGLLPELGGSSATGSAALSGLGGMLASPVGKVLAGAATYYGMDKLEEFLNTTLGADKDSGMFRKGAATTSRVLFDAAKGGLVGLEAGYNGGGIAGSVAGLVQGLYNAGTGQGWDYGTKGSIGSYAVGSYNLPKDEIAQVHKGEMILPASIAQAVRTSLHNSSTKTAGSTQVTIQLSLASGSDEDVMRVGKKIKSIIEDPTISASMKER
jgi:hypothetical protein